jgi:large subunit ribosomal protein L23
MNNENHNIQEQINDIDQIKLIFGPHLTEKSFQANTEKQQHCVFKVARNANKFEIKAAIEKMFDVKVASVNTLVQKGKTKMFKQRVGKRSDWKKAYVKLEDGFEFNFIGSA